MNVINFFPFIERSKHFNLINWKLVDDFVNNGGCFPSESKVKLEDGKLTTMSKLQIGDKVQTGKCMGKTVTISQLPVQNRVQRAEGRFCGSYLTHLFAWKDLLIKKKEGNSSNIP